MITELCSYAVGFGVGGSRNFSLLFLFLLLFALLPIGGYSTTTELVFIDTAVQDWEVLRDGVRPGVEVVLLDPAGDELAQMTSAINERRDISAIHIISHGHPGAMVLGGQVIDSAALERNEALLKSWRGSLAPGADLLIYGCEVGKESASGGNEAYLSALADATGADVAVSTDFTGAKDFKGNWSLELKTGAIDSKPLQYFNFDGLLQIINGTSSPVISEVTFTGNPLIVGFNVTFTVLPLVGATYNMNTTAPAGWNVTPSATLSPPYILATPITVSFTITNTGTDTSGSFPLSIYSVAGGLGIGSEITGSTVTVNVNVNQPPTLDLNGSDSGTGHTVTLANAATGLANISSATASDTENSAANWNGGSLTVQRVTSGTADGSANDVFSFLSGVNKTGTIAQGSNSNGTLSDGITQFATWTYTTATGLLSIAFDSNATTARVQTLIRNIGYANATPYGDATIRFALNDGTSTTNADVSVTSSTIYVDVANDDSGGDAADGFSLREALARGVAQTGADTIKLEKLTGTQTVTLTGSTVTFGGGDTLQHNLLNNTLTIAGSGGGGIALGGAGTTGTLQQANNASVIISAPISGSGSISKTGGASLTLSGTNTYSGSTSMANGTLTLNGGSAIPDGSAVTVNGGTLVLGANETVGSLSGAGDVDLGTYTLTTGGNNTSTELSGVISDNPPVGKTGGRGSVIRPYTNPGGSLIKTGTGTFTLSGSNTYTGSTTVSGGTLSIGSDSHLGTGAITLAAGTTLQITGATTINNAIALSGSATISNSAAVTLSGVVSGSGGLTKTDSGVLTLSGSNTYTGTTTVSAGTLSIALDSNLGSGSVSLAAGTILQITGATVVDNAIALSGSATVSNSAAVTLSGVISGSNNLIKSGTGTLSLSAVNTYTGTTTVSAGTLVVFTDSNLGGGSVSLAAGTTLQISNATTIDNSIVLNGDSTISNFDSVTLSGVLSGAGSLTKSGGATLTFSASNSYTGNTVVTEGTLTLSGGSAIADSGAVSMSSSSNLILTNSETVGSLFGAGFITLGANNITIGDGTSTIFAGNISGTGGLTKTGVGVLTLSGFNSFTGSAVISSGTLTLSGGTAISDSGPMTVASGATVNLASSETMGSLSGAGFVTLGANTLTTGDSNSTTFSGVISGSGGLTKAGAGALTLSGTNTHTGATTITGGTLSLSGGSAIPDTGAVKVSSGTLQLLSSESVGSVAEFGAIDLGSYTLTTGLDNTDTYVSGVISGAGALIKSGTGEFGLYGSNTFTGTTTVSGGTLTLQSSGSLPNTAVVIVESVGALNLNASKTLGSLAGAGDCDLNSFTLTTGGDNTSTEFSGNFFGSSGTLIKTGTGTFTLSGSNTNTGAITVSAGTLVLGGGSAINDSSNLTVSSGATLTLSDSETVASLAGAGNVGLGTSTITTGSGFNTTFSGVISGAGNLVKGGNGVELTLSGANTYTGSTTVESGKLILAGGSAIVNDTPVTLNSGGTLQLSASETIGSVTGAGSIYLAGFTLTTGGNNSDTTFSGSLTSGSGVLVKNGTGEFTLSGNNAFTGSISVVAGNLVLSGGSAVSDLTPVTLAANASLVLSSTETIGGLSGAGTVSLNSNTLTSNSITDATFSGVIDGSGNFAKTGSGTLFLSGTNTFDGNTTVNSSGGILAVSGGGALPDNYAISVNSGGTLKLLSSETVGSLTGSGYINLESNTLTVGENDADSTYSGIMSGTGSLTKVGTGTFTLSSSNSYTGLTTVSEGTLHFATSLPVPNNAAVSVISDATLIFSSSIYLGALSGEGDLLLGSNSLTIGNGNLSSEFAGDISGSGALNKLGTGTFTLSGQNTYTGNTTVEAGILDLNGGAAIADTVSVSVWDHATLRLSENETVGSLGTTNDGLVSLSSHTLTVGGNNKDKTVSGDISGTGGLEKTGTGNLTLFGQNTYTGPTVVSNGNLIVTAGQAIHDQSAVTVSSGATLTLWASETIGSLTGEGTVSSSGALLTTGGNNQSTEFSGVISQTHPASNSLIKSGTGTFTLSGINTYTGSTGVTAGKLSVTGALAGTDSVAVASGTVLGGTGTVQGLVTASSGGTIAPGLSPGKLTLNGGLTLSSGSVFSVEINGATAGTDYDQIVVADGAVNLASATLSIALGYSPLAGSTFVLIDNQASNAITGTFSGLTEGSTTSANGKSLQISYVGGTGNDVVLTILNYAPVLDNTQSPALASIPEDVTNEANSGATIAAIVVDNSITDLNGSPVEAIAVTAADNANGAWQYSTDNGSSWTAFGVVSDATALLLDPANKIRFVPNADYNGSSTFTFRAWDQSSGTAGGTADASINGGTTAYSTATDTASITITPVYDPPSLKNLSSDIAWAGIGNPVTLDSDVDLSAVDLDALNNGNGDYCGVTMTVKRRDVAVTADQFSLDTTGASFTVDGTILRFGGQSFASYTNANGVVNVQFYDGGATPTSLLVDQVARSLTYRNDTPAGDALIDYVVSDGITTATETITVTSNYVYINDTGDTSDSDRNTITLREAIDISKDGSVLRLVSSVFSTSQTITLTTGLYGGKNLTYDWSDGHGVTITGDDIETDGILTIISGPDVTDTISANLLDPQDCISLVKSGTGSVVLAGFNDYAGTTTVNAGILSIDTEDQLGDDSIILNGGTLAVTGAAAIVNDVTLSADSAVFNSDVVTLSGIVSGSGGLRKTGSGALTLSGTNTYTGTTTVSASTLSIGTDNNLGSGTITLQTGTILQITIGTTVDNSIVLSGNATISDSTDVTLSGVISGSGGLTKTGSGILTLSGTNTFTGATTVSAGALTLSYGAALSNNSAVTVNAGATLFLSSSEEIGPLSGVGNIYLGSFTLTTGGDTDTTFSGNIADSQVFGKTVGRQRVFRPFGTDEGGSLTKTGTGTLTLSGTNSYTDTTTVSGGTLSIGTDGNLGTGTITLSAGTALQVTSNTTIDNSIALSGSATISNSTDVTFSGVISGSGGLSKTGSGTLTLSAPNTNTGTITVSAGKLILTNSNIGLYSIASGAILGGTGTVQGLVTASNGGTLAPGLSPGQMTFNGGLTLSSGSTFSVEINGATAGVDYDQIVVADGTVNLTGATLSTALGFTPAIGDSFRIIDNQASNAITGTFSGLAEGGTISANGKTLQISYEGGTGNDVVLTVLNEAPVLDNTHSPTLASIPEDVTGEANIGTSVADIVVDNSITDPDGSPVEAIAVTAADNANGTWQYSTDNGSNWTDFGAVSNTSARLLDGTLTGANTHKIRFIPNLNYNGTATISFRAWDKTGGSAGNTADTSTNGGTTAFSQATDSASINITQVNDAPTLANLSNNSVAWAGINNSVTLDEDVEVGDPELDAINNGNGDYSGATLTLQRSGIAVTSDDFDFAASGASFTNDGSHLRVGGQSFATYTDSNGVLTIQFNDGGAVPTTALVNEVLQRITYQNNTPAGYANLIYTFSDGEKSITDSVFVRSNYIYINDTGDTSDSDRNTITLREASSFVNSDNVLRLDSTVFSTTKIITLGSDIHIEANNPTFDFSNGHGVSLTGAEIYLVGSITFISGTGITDTIHSDLIDPDGCINLIKSGAGTLVLSGSNDYIGTTTVLEGVLSVVSEDQLGDDSIILNGGTLALTGAATIENDITLSSASTISNSSAVTLSGVLSDSGNLTKSGAGILTLSHSNKHTGTILVSEGTLRVNGSLGGTLSVAVANGAVLDGTGSIGSFDDGGTVTVQSGGTLAAGASPGTLTLNDGLILLPGGILAVEIDGTAVGTGYDRVVVQGSVTLTGSTLSTTFGYTSSLGDSYTLIDNDGSDAVVGTFSGLAEGAAFTQNAKTYQISYVGGNGNDVVLTAVNNAPVLDGSFSPILTAIDEDNTASAGDSVSAILVDNSITDPDGSAVEALAVIAVDNTNGAWQYSTDNGSNWTAFGTVSESTARLLDGTLTGSNTHKIRFVPSANFNGSAMFTFRAWDKTAGTAGGTADTTGNGGLFAFSGTSDTASIAVNPVNDSPAASVNAGLTVNEGASATLSSSQLHLTDLEQGASALTLTLTAIPLHGGLQINGATLAIGNTLTQDDIDNNRITYTHNAGETTADSFAFTVSDGAGGSLGSTPFAITVTPENDPPVLEINNPLDTVGAIVNPLTTEYLKASDVDNASAQIAFTLSVEPQFGVVAVSGATRTVSQAFTQDDLEQNRVTYTVTQIGHPTDFFRFVVNDGAGGSVNEATFSLKLNTPPTVATNTGLTLNEGALSTITQAHLRVTDLEQAASALIYTVTQTPVHGALSVAGATLVVNATFSQADIDNNLLRYIHDGGESTSDIFTYVITDGSGGSINGATFAVTVNPVNDAPHFVTPAATTATEDLPYVYNIVTGDVDAGVATLTLSVIAKPSWMSFNATGNGTGTLSGVPANEQVGSSTVTLRVSDGALSADQSFTLTVVNVNDWPSFTSTPVTSAQVEQFYQYNISASDPDPGVTALVFTAFSKPSWLGLIDHGNGTATLSGVPKAAQVGPHTVYLWVQDGQALSEQSFTITVAPAPTGTPTVTPTSTATATATPSPTTTDTPVPTATDTATPTVTASSTAVPTVTPTSTALATETATPIHTTTFAPTATATLNPTATTTPTSTATATRTVSPTSTHTPNPSATVTSTSTITPSITPTPTPDCLLTVDWNLEDFGFPLSDILDIHLYVQEREGLNTGGLNQIGDFFYLGRTGDGSATSFTWHENAAHVALQFIAGPDCALNYEFQLWIIVRQGEGGVFQGPYGRFRVNGVLHGATPTPTAMLTPSPMATDTPTPTRPGTIFPTFTPTAAIQGGVVPSTDNGLLLSWNLEDLQTDLSRLVDIHIYIRTDFGEVIEGLNEIDGYYYLGRTGDGVSEYFLWRKGGESIAPAFQNGPQIGRTYEFQLWFLLLNEDGVGVTYVGPDQHFQARELTLAEIPPATPTPTVTPTPKSAFVTTGDQGVVLRWNRDDYAALLGATVDIHVYVRTNFGETVEGLNQINGYYYLGQTGSGTADFFTWRKGYPGIHPVFAEGPQAGQAYEFQLYFIQVQNGTTRFEGPFQRFTVQEYEMPVTVHDTLQSVADLSGAADFDTAAQRSLTVRWDLSQEPLNEDSVSQFHVYMRPTTQSDFVYLGQTANGQGRELEWRVGATSVAPDFRVGPQFGQDYEFRVFALRDNVTPAVYGPLLAKGPLSYRAAVGIYDDTQGQEELSGGVDLDPAGQEALAIRWSIDETALTASDVKEYHVYVQTDGGANYLYLGKSGAAQNELLWTNNGTGLHKDFRSGPTAGHAYAFRVFALSLTAGQRPYGPFEAGGSVRLETGTEGTISTSTPTLVPTPTVSPTPTVTPGL